MERAILCGFLSICWIVCLMNFCMFGLLCTNKRSKLHFSFQEASSKLFKNYSENQCLSAVFLFLSCPGYSEGLHFHLKDLSSVLTESNKHVRQIETSICNGSADLALTDLFKQRKKRRKFWMWFCFERFSQCSMSWLDLRFFFWEDIFLVKFRILNTHTLTSQRTSKKKKTRDIEACISKHSALTETKCNGLRQQWSYGWKNINITRLHHEPPSLFTVNALM